MKLVIAAATQLEIQPLISYLQQHRYSINNHSVQILITGVGSLVSTYRLTRFITEHKPGYCIQAGLAGTFTSELSNGQVVLVRADMFGDLGAEESSGFTDVFDLKLIHDNEHPFTDKQLINPYLNNWKNMDLNLVYGVTVNEISTRESRITLLQTKYRCQVESMEGAAFHYVCLQENTPFLQLRAISNLVGERDKSKWKMKEAIGNLNNSLVEIINTKYFE